MTLLQAFSLGLLVITFAIALWRQVNVGLAMLPAAFVLAEIAGISPSTLYAGFPSSLVILVLGVMYLFAHAQRSGGIDRLLVAAERIVGVREWLLPWVFFLLAALISAIGALPIASLAIIIPIAMQAARRRSIDPMLMATVVILGTLAGGFSPISVGGQLIYTLGLKVHYVVPLYALFGLEFVLNVGLAVAAFFIFGGWHLLRRSRQDFATTKDAREILEPSASGLGNSLIDQLSSRNAIEEDAAATSTEAIKVGIYEIASLTAIALFVVAVLTFGFDVGLTAFALGLILYLIFPGDEHEIIMSLPWPVVLILGGVVTYINLLLKIGTLQAITQHLQSLNSSVLIILGLVYFTSVFAAFTPAISVLAVVIPVALQVELGAEHMLLLLVLTAVAYSAVVTSTSPFLASGALAIANSGDAVEASILFRRLLFWTIGVAAVVPALSSLLPFALKVI